MKSILLTIYAYSSFVSPWGPGPKIVDEFKKRCLCEVALKETEDLGLLIKSLSSRKLLNPPDVLLGFDQLGIKTSTSLIAWRDLSDLQPKGFVGSGTYKNFVAFDWAPMSFVYKKSQLTQPPKSLNDLLSKNFSAQILLEDPRLSSPGLQFLTWVYLSKKDETRSFLKNLKPQIHSIAPTWSTAYGLFKKDQAKLVFSYLSSPIYHWKEEKNFDFQATAFGEPHALQTEWVGIPNTCVSCDKAKEFVTFLLSDEAQKILMDYNYMYPVNKRLIIGSLYEKLPKVKTYTPADYDTVPVEKILKTWKDSLP